MPTDNPASGYGELIGAGDPLTVVLAEIKERAKEAAELPLEEIASFKPGGVRSISGWIAASALDVPRLVAALEAVLALTADWEADSLEIPLQHREAAALAVRAHIRAALLGEEAGDD